MTRPSCPTSTRRGDRDAPPAPAALLSDLRARGLDVDDGAVARPSTLATGGRAPSPAVARGEVEAGRRSSYGPLDRPKSAAPCASRPTTASPSPRKGAARASWAARSPHAGADRPRPHGTRPIVVSIDVTANLVSVEAGVFGPDLESHLRDRGFTLGHFPQSFDLATVGGWIACRGAGQFSNRYGKIDDIVRALTVVLARRRRLDLGGRGTSPGVGRPGPRSSSSSAPRAPWASSPRRHSSSIDDRAHSRRAAYRFATFDGGSSVSAPPPARRAPRGAAPLRRDGVQPSVRRAGMRPDRARRGRRRVWSTRRCPWSPRSATRRRRSDPTSSRAGSTTATTSARSRPCGRRGLVVDTIEVAGCVVRARRRCTAAVRRAFVGLARDDRRLGAPVPRLPRGCVPLLHLRRSARGRGRRVLPRGVGRRHARRCIATGGVDQPPPRRRAQPRALRRSRARQRLRGPRLLEGVNPRPRTTS